MTQATSDVNSQYWKDRHQSGTINDEEEAQAEIEEFQHEIDAEELFLRDDVSGRSDETCPVEPIKEATKDAKDQGRYTEKYIKMMMVVDTMISGRESMFVSAQERPSQAQRQSRLAT